MAVLLAHGARWSIPQKGIQVLCSQNENSADRLTAHTIARRKIILCEVITRYTLIDEHLNLPLCHCFFGRKKFSIQP